MRVFMRERRSIDTGLKVHKVLEKGDSDGYARNFDQAQTHL